MTANKIIDDSTSGGTVNDPTRTETINDENSISIQIIGDDLITNETSIGSVNLVETINDSTMMASNATLMRK